MTGDALDFALESLGFSDRDLREQLMESYLRLETFPEVPEVLERLEQGYQDRDLVQRLLSACCEPRSPTRASNLCSMRFCRSKRSASQTHPKVYQLAVDRLELEPRRIWFQSSNAWDAWAASAFGMRVAWCNRYGQRPERLPAFPTSKSAPCWICRFSPTCEGALMIRRFGARTRLSQPITMAESPS